MQIHYIDEINISLLSLIDWAEKKDFDLPADLSDKHDNYLWKAIKQRK